MLRQLIHASFFFVVPLTLLVLFAYIDGHWTEDPLEPHDNCLEK